MFRMTNTLKDIIAILGALDITLIICILFRWAYLKGWAE